MIAEITDPKLWNDFAAQCQPHTFLHSWEWGQVQKATGENVKYLGIFSPPYEGGVAPQSRGGFKNPYPSAPAEVLPLRKGEKTTLLAVALVIIVNARRGRHYLIPHGPLVRDANQYENVLTEFTQYLKQRAKQDNVVALRIAPLVETSPEAQQVFFSLGFRPAPLHIHAELTWLLDITKSEEELLTGMRKTTRHAIVKAEKAGVTTEVVVDSNVALERFWPLYEYTRRRHGFVLWPKKLLAAQLEEFGKTNRIFSIFARCNNHDVAAAILPHFGDTVFYYHGASIKVPGSPPAAQLLQWAAIREAKKRGAKHYNFWGIAPANQPKHPFAGITTFKQGFGGHAVDYLHAQDLPLGAAYRLLWAVDTYRKFKRGF